jgi:hypothetical protein
VFVDFWILGSEGASMKKLNPLYALMTAALLLFCSPALASFTINNVVENYCATTSCTITVTIPSGHTIGIWLYSTGDAATLGTITDSTAGAITYTKGANFGTAFNDTTGFAWAIAIPTGITSITYTPFGGAATAASMVVWDITATGTIVASDNKSNLYGFDSPNTTDGITTTSMTLTSSDGLLLAAAIDQGAGALTAGTGFTSDISVGGNSLVGEHKAVTASAAATFTAANMNDFVLTAGLAFQVSSGGPVINGVVMSNGHPVKSGTSVLYK